MHVLVGRGGELAAPFGPVCDDTDCTCNHGLAGLDSRCPVERITVAEHPDITLAQLTAECAAFLADTGWDDHDGQIAANMATGAAAIAHAFPIGTRLHARYDHRGGDWTFIPQHR
jgi:hypothetical protein